MSTSTANADSRRLPEEFLVRYRDKGAASKIMGLPLDGLTREELLAVIGHLHETEETLRGEIEQAEEFWGNYYAT